MRKKKNPNVTDNLFFGSNSNSRRRTEDPLVWDEGFQFALHVLLPVTIAALIWGRKAIISRLLLHLDRSCISVFCPSFSKREKLLKWISTYLPYLEGGIGTIWTDGSQLCTLINTVIPGACTNPHRHWKKNPSHGQALAYKYFGVIPIFTDIDLNQRNITPSIEKCLIEYLESLQEAIIKISPKEDLSYTNQYLARGMGLVTGEQNRKTILYIYANNKNKYLDDLLINIRGPYNIYGAATILGDELSKYLITRNKRNVKNSLVDRKRRRSFFQSISSDFSNLLVAKKEIAHDIEIKIDMEIGRARVTFIPKYSGVFEICLTTNGEHISGSPYNINIEKNTSGIIDNLKDDKKRSIRKFPLSASTEEFKPRLLPILRSKTDGYFKNFNVYEENFEFHFKQDEDLKFDETENVDEEEICYLILNENDLNENNNNVYTKHLDNYNESIDKDDELNKNISLSIEKLIDINPFQKDIATTIDSTTFKNIDTEYTDPSPFEIATIINSYEIKDSTALNKTIDSNHKPSKIAKIFKNINNNTNQLSVNAIKITHDNQTLKTSKNDNIKIIEGHELDEANFKSIKEIKSILECYNPDLLVGHTDFDNKSKISPVLKDTVANEVEAMTAKPKDPNIFIENTSVISSSSPVKNKLQKTNAIDHDDLSSRNLPNLLSDLQNKAFDSMSSEDSIDANLMKRIEFWNKLSSQSSLDISTSLSDLKNTSNKVLTKVKSLESQITPFDFINNRKKLQRSHSLCSSVDDLNFPSVKERKSLFLTGWNTETGSNKNKTIKEKISIKDKIKLFDNSNCKSISTKNLDVIQENSSVKTKIKEGFEKAKHFFRELESKNGGKTSFSTSNQSLITNRNRSVSENDLRKRSLKQAKSLDVINLPNYNSNSDIREGRRFKTKDAYSTKLELG